MANDRGPSKRDNPGGARRESGNGGNSTPARKGDSENTHSPRGTSGAFPEEPNEDGEDGEAENDQDALNELEEEE